MVKVIEEKEIPIDLLYINGENVRKEVGDLTDLENSIEHHGVLEPIVVRPGKGGKYAVIIGGRRYRAAKNVGVKKIPAIVKDLTDAEAFAESAAENIQRSNLSPNEEAEMYHRALEIYGSQEEIAKMFGVPRRDVSRQLEGWNLIQTAKAAGIGKRAHVPIELPQDRLKTDTISRAAKDVFPEAPKKQIELFEALKDRPRDEVKRAVEYVKAKVETEPKVLERKPISEVVKEAFKVPTVEVSIRFGAELSRGLIKAMEDRGISYEDIVRLAVEQWLKEGGFLA